MRILIACEESQTVCKAFRKKGHEAYSCDIDECSGGHPEWHIQADVLQILKLKWDMVIAHPPCTHLSVSGAPHFEAKRKDGRQRESIEFFMKVWESDCEKMVLENPVNIIGGDYIKKWFPDLCQQYMLPLRHSQYIHPYEYGHPEQKKTALWIRGLPLLEETDNVYEHMMTLPKKERERILWLGSNKSRERSKTYQGIAEAMAEQWG